MDWAEPFLARLGVQTVAYQGDLVEAVCKAEGHQWAVAKHAQGKNQERFVAQTLQR